MWVEAIVLGALAITLYYVYFFTKFRRCGIPGPTPLPVIGNLYHQLKMGYEQADKKWECLYGKVYGVYSGHNQNVMVTDLEFLKQVFVKDFDSFHNRRASSLLPKTLRRSLFFEQDTAWKTTRNIITPTFSGAKLKMMINEISGCASVLADSLRQMDGGVGVEVKRIFSAYSCDVIATVSFGIDIDCQRNPEEPFMRNLQTFLKPPANYFGRIPFIITAIFPSFGWVLSRLGMSFTDEGAVAYFEDMCRALVDERKRCPRDRTDFLQLLLNAEDATTQDSRSEDLQQSDNDSCSYKRLSTDQIVAQTMLFFVAGYETTASVLRYAAYILALHPDIDEKLVQEIEAELQDRQPSYDDLTRLKYMDQFIKETLRMFPPSPRLNRVVKRDTVYKGMTIPRGSAVIVPVYHIQHDPDNYSCPEQFNMDRFSAENKKNLNPVAFLPFGYGPRQCTGMRLGLVEVKVALIYILRAVKFVKCPDTKVPLELKQINAFLRTGEPTVLAIERRTGRNQH